MFAGCNTKYQITNHNVALHLASQHATGNLPKPNFETRNQKLNFDCSESLAKQGIKPQAVETARCDQKEGTAEMGM